MGDDFTRSTGRSRLPGQAHRNPLERSVDRAEARLYRALVTLFLFAVPFVLVLGVGVYHQQQGVAQSAAETVSTVRAVTTEDAPPTVTAPGDLSALDPTVTVPARWTLNGTEHVGTAPVSADSPTGTSVTITVDQQGRRVPPPVTGPDVVIIGIFTVTALLAVLLAALVGVRALAARRFDRRRDQEWDEALARLFA